MILALRSSVRKFISQRKELPAENCGLATKNQKKEGCQGKQLWTRFYSGKKGKEKSFKVHIYSFNAGAC